MSGETIFYIAALLVIGFGMFKAMGHYFSRPRRFLYGEVPFIWVPGGGYAGPFSALYEGGTFHHEDGSPVTDERLIAALETHWEEINRPRGTDDHSYGD